MSDSAGLHVIIDAYVADSAVFKQEKLEALFSDLLSALDMKPLDKAMFYEVPVDPEILERVKRTGNFEDEGGTSALQVISTSHLSIHTWPLQKFLSLDAFSCKTFDAGLAVSLIRDHLGIVSCKTGIIDRFKPSTGEDRIYTFSMGEAASAVRELMRL